VVTWEKYLQVLPKIAPTDREKAYPLQVWRLGQTEEPASDEPGISEIENIDDTKKVIPFWQLATRAGNLVRELFNHMEIMRGEVDKFANSVAEHFAIKWHWATRFAQHWRKPHLQEFLDWPFTSVPIIADDEPAKEYGRWILAPKFFDPGIGIKLHHFGGYRLELINAYTRMEFPLETDWVEKLGVPSNLNLEVKGNKVLGPSLPFCWKDIPGLVEDSDSNEEWTSVYMHDPRATRIWLAQHGIRPWEKSRIPFSHLTDMELEREISKSPLYLSAWRKLSQNGRLAVFWPSIMESRRFACLAGMMLRGTTAVLVSTNEDKFSWQGLYSQATSYQEIRTPYQFVYLTNHEKRVWEAVLQCKSIIIDMAGELDVSVLDYFFDYHGVLIIINSDPISDFFSTNLIIAKVFALTGWQVFEAASWEDWGTHTMKSLPIEETFDGLNAYWRTNKLATDVRTYGMKKIKQWPLPDDGGKVEEVPSPEPPVPSM